MPVRCPINGMIIPNLNKCNEYYQCVSNTFVKKTCPSGQKFSTLLMKCVTATTGKCAQPNNQTTVTGPTTTPRPCLLNVKIPNVLNCKKYYACQNNRIAEQVCPSSAPYYNCLTRNCSTTKVGICCASLSSKNMTCSTNGSRTAVPMSCISYYECLNGTFKKQNCPYFTAYDIWSNTCKSPITARCGLKPGMTVCSAGFNSSLPFGYVNFNLQTVCPSWSNTNNG